MESSGLAAATRSGLNWNFLSFGFRLVFDFGVSVALARMLAPRDFGVVALAYIVIQISDVIGHFGMGRALVQRKNLAEIDKHVAFVTSISVAGFVGLIFYVLAPAASDFFDSPILTPVIRVLSLQIVASGAMATAVGLLQRSMNFRALSIVDVLKSAVVGTVAISMAWSGFGVWSLIWPSVVASGGQAIVLNYLARHLPRPRFDIASFRSLFSFGGLITVKNFLVYGGRNADYFVIGKWLGEASLGLYAKAFSLVSTSQRGLISVLGTAFFPAFSRLQDNKEKLGSWYLKATQVLASMVIPAYVGLSSIAGNFTIAVFSEKWIGMIGALQVLCIAGAINAIKSLSGSVLEATGNVKIELWTHAIRTAVILFGSMAVVGTGGIEAVAWVVLIAHAVDFVFKGKILERYIGIRFSTLLGTLWWPALASLVMAVVVMSLQHVRESPMENLLISVPAGILTYVSFVFLFARRQYRFLLEVASGQVASLRLRKPRSQKGPS